MTVFEEGLVRLYERWPMIGLHLCPVKEGDSLHRVQVTKQSLSLSHPPPSPQWLSLLPFLYPSALPHPLPEIQILPIASQTSSGMDAEAPVSMVTWGGWCTAH
jgi:hypothetical protein